MTLIDQISSGARDKVLGEILNVRSDLGAPGRQRSGMLNVPNDLRGREERELTSDRAHLVKGRKGALVRQSPAVQVTHDVRESSAMPKGPNVYRAAASHGGATSALPSSHRLAERTEVQVPGSEDLKR